MPETRLTQKDGRAKREECYSKNLMMPENKGARILARVRAPLFSSATNTVCPVALDGDKPLCQPPCRMRSYLRRARTSRQSRESSENLSGAGAASGLGRRSHCCIPGSRYPIGPPLVTEITLFMICLAIERRWPGVFCGKVVLSPG